MTITITGVDQQTNRDWLRQTARRPEVEIGILLSGTPEGRNRYPDRDWIQGVVDAIGRKAALHICGGVAREWLLHRQIETLVAPVGRIQVNGRVGTSGLSVRVVELLCARYPEKVIITQHCQGNESLLQVKSPNHALLVDASGGRGLMPEVWIRPETDKHVGFAGGLDPDHLYDQLTEISQAAGGRPFWCDMEGRLRSQGDWFDTRRADACISTHLEWSRLRELEALRDEVDRLNAIIHTPHTNDFLRAVSIEAEHARQDPKSAHDEFKDASDWFWLIGYLAGKAMHADKVGDHEKVLHHIITTAGACANWHRVLRARHAAAQAAQAELLDSQEAVAP